MDAGKETCFFSAVIDSPQDTGQKVGWFLESKVFKLSKEDGKSLILLKSRLCIWLILIIKVKKKQKKKNA